MNARSEGRERLVVAMSGGVDSSLAAAFAVAAGYQVIGVTMHLSAGGASRCCSLADADDARRVAESLGIRFMVANYTERFEAEVIEPFADAYLAGRTPIPCVACNKKFKFDYLLARAGVFGAKRVATGHYARIDSDPETGLRRLLRARDRDKDQSYFLFQLDQRQLAGSWFPLGDMTKTDVRRRARELGLATASKPESQEICFVPEGGYAEVVERLRPEARRTGGEIVDAGGRVLGRHAGVHRFTIGQRRGLGITSERPLYVTRIDASARRVVVGERDELLTKAARVDAVCWVAGRAPLHPVHARVQVRHRDVGEMATIEPGRGTGVGGDADRSARVVFDRAVRALAPGQAAVFYDGDSVLGGGWIGGPLT